MTVIPLAPARTRARDLWSPFLVLVGAIALCLVVAEVVDASALDQGTDSWGYVFGVIVISMIYGGPTLLVTFLLALVGTLLPEGRGRVWLARAGAGVVAVCGFALGVFLLVSLFQEPVAGKVFSGLALPAAALLMLPAFRALPASRGSRA